MSLPWDKQKITESTEVREVAEKFIRANCYDPAVLILSWEETRLQILIKLGKLYILQSTSLDAREETPPNQTQIKKPPIHHPPGRCPTGALV